ncbi:hypothetical protein GEMRC1_004576 [Eukaryota sp. GEM-RC1]
MVTKHTEKLGRLIRSSKEGREEYDFFVKVQEMLENGDQVRFGQFDPREIDWINSFQLLTAKPVIYLINLSEEDYVRKKNKWLKPIAQWIKAHGNETAIPFSAQYETTLAALDPESRQAYIAENKVPSMVDRIVHLGYKTLNLHHYFTAGEKEVKCWTIRAGYTAPQAAGRIHTDMMNNFIMAEVMPFEDLKEQGTENGVKAAGKLKMVGKTGIIEDGDVVLFKFGQAKRKR